jgi:hypothetical protein
MPEFAPRFMRPPEAAYYCGMGRTVFEREIRPMLQKIRIGKTGVGFDIVDLNHALDDYKSRNVMGLEDESCQNPSSKVSHGTSKQDREKSISASQESDAFKSALEQVRGRKQRRRSTGR